MYFPSMQDSILSSVSTVVFQSGQKCSESTRQGAKARRGQRYCEHSGVTSPSYAELKRGSIHNLITLKDLTHEDVKMCQLIEYVITRGSSSTCQMIVHNPTSSWKKLSAELRVSSSGLLSSSNGFLTLSEMAIDLNQCSNIWTTCPRISRTFTTIYYCKS